MRHRLTQLSGMAVPVVILALFWMINHMLLDWVTVRDWSQKYITDFFPKAEVIASYQNQVFGVAATLLAVCFTIIVVAYSASEIDRRVVRVLILEHRRTGFLLTLFASTIAVNGLLALRELNEPFIGYAQLAIVAVLLYAIGSYMRWFSQRLDLQMLAKEASGAPLDVERRLSLLSLLLRNAIKSGRISDITDVFNEFVDVATASYRHAIEHGKDSQTVRNVFVEVLTEVALEAVRAHNQQALRIAVSAVYRLSRTVPLDTDPVWAEAILQWFRDWHYECLRSPDNDAFSNPDFNTIFLYIEELFIRRVGSIYRGANG